MDFPVVGVEQPEDVPLEEDEEDAVVYSKDSFDLHQSFIILFSIIFVLVISSCFVIYIISIIVNKYVFPQRVQKVMNFKIQSFVKISYISVSINTHIIHKVSRQVSVIPNSAWCDQYQENSYY